jgi:SAM-dependent methyltransferase
MYSATNFFISVPPPKASTVACTASAATPRKPHKTFRTARLPLREPSRRDQGAPVSRTEVLHAPPDDIVAGYEAIYEPLTARFGARLVELAGGVGRDDRALDSACGTGALSLILARRTGRLVAIDLDPAMTARLAERLREAGLTAAVRVMDGQVLAFPDAAFDVAFSAFGVMLFPDFRAGLHELARVVGPGGRVGVAVWAQPEGSPAAIPFRRALGAAFPDRPLPALRPGSATLCDSGRLRTELEAAGLDNVRIEAVEAPWRAVRPHWIAANVGRLYGGHDAWIALSAADKARVRAAFVAEAAAEAQNRPLSARALLAVGRKRDVG